MASPAVFISGGGGGIGAALARRASRAGWFALVAGRGKARLEALAAELRSSGGGAAAIELDLEDPSSPERACAAAQRACGGPEALTALANCAGIAVSAPLLGAQTGEENFRRHFAVNFDGPRRLIEALAPAWRARREGRIVNVASSAGLRGYAYTAAYCASKHALVGYTRAAAQELAGSGVSISAVCPHYVDSPLTDASVRRIVEKTKKSEAEARAFLAKQNPGGRLLSCEEVADAIWSLIEQRENGTILELDGARALRIEGPVAGRG